MSQPQQPRAEDPLAGDRAFAQPLAGADLTARPRNSTALCLIACAFLAAVVFRANGLRHEIGALLTSPANAAIAQAEARGDAEAAPPEPSTGEPSAKPTAQPAANPMTEPQPRAAPNDGGQAGESRCLDGAFQAALLEREDELASIGLEMDGRRRELEVVERRVAAQLAELARQQDALRAAFGQAESAAEEEAMQLVSIYEKMKPKQAALIFDQMPPAVAAGFVRRMRQTNSALIMANMEPQKAYAISLLLASRSGAVREQ